MSMRSLTINDGDYFNVGRKEVLWQEEIPQNYRNRLAPLLDRIEGIRFLVFSSPTDSFEEYLTPEQHAELASCDALVVLRWGNNVKAATSQFIDTGMEKRPVIQIQYDENQAEIISQPML